MKLAIDALLCPGTPTEWRMRDEETGLVYLVHYRFGELSVHDADWSHPPIATRQVGGEWDGHMTDGEGLRHVAEMLSEETA